jgi:hypothetical protein
MLLQHGVGKERGLAAARIATVVNAAAGIIEAEEALAA